MADAPEQFFPSNPGIARLLRGNYNAAIVNHTSGDITMSDCTTNVTFMSTPAELSDFRKIPLGDIDLHDLRLEPVPESHSGTVDNRPVWRSIRRVYSANIETRRSDVTVAIY